MNGNGNTDDGNNVNKNGDNKMDFLTPCLF